MYMHILLYTIYKASILYTCMVCINTHTHTYIDNSNDDKKIQGTECLIYTEHHTVKVWNINSIAFIIGKETEAVLD